MRSPSAAVEVKKPDCTNPPFEPIILFSGWYTHYPQQSLAAKEELLVVCDINNDDDNDLLADRYREGVEDSTDIYINNGGGWLVEQRILNC